MTRAIADQSKTIRIPVHMVDTINLIIKAEKALTQNFGRAPTIEEISDYLGGAEAGYSAKKIRDIKKISLDPVSLDKPVGYDEESRFINFVGDNDSLAPDKITEKQLCTEEINKLFKSVLEEVEEDVIRRRFGLHPYAQTQTLEEIGEALNKTRERIRQIEAKALRKLKQPSKNSKLRTFFTNSD